MNEIPHPGFDKPEEYETFTTTNGLEEAAKNYAELLPQGRVSKKYSAIDFIAGAKWQKEKDEKDLADMLIVEYLRGVEWGKQDTKEQMMKKAWGAKVVGKDISNRTIILTDVPTELDMNDRIRLHIDKDD